MRRIFLFLLISLFCFNINAKWVEAARSDMEITYINTNMTYDEEGTFYLTVKVVPLKTMLQKRRKEYIDLFQSSRYKKYTHSVNQWRVDFTNNMIMIIGGTDYANNDVLTVTNMMEGETKWLPVRYNTVGSEVIRVARIMVENSK